MRHAVAKTEELKPGQMKAVNVGRKSILLVRNLEGEYYAIRNVCPHKGVELSLGTLGGTMAADDIGVYRLERKGEIVRCPWHSWEFDVKTGCALVEPDSVCVRTYEVSIEDDMVFVSN